MWVICDCSTTLHLIIIRRANFRPVFRPLILSFPHTASFAITQLHRTKCHVNVTGTDGYMTFRPMQFQPLTISTYCIFNFSRFRPDLNEFCLFSPNSVELLFL